MTDAFDGLRTPAVPVAPDPGFARALRARLERALLAPEGPELREETMTVTDTARAGAAAALRLHAITPYLAVADAAAALDFYVTAFGAVRRGEPIVMPDGRIGHAEVALGDSVLMLADEFPELGLLAPSSRGGASQSLRLEVADPDAVVERAVAEGGVLERPVTDSPYGRGGVVVDPSGHRWMVSREPTGPRPGDVVYASLWTGDAARSEQFYRAVLGRTPAPDAGLGASGGHTQPTLMVCYAVLDLDAALAAVRAGGGTAGEPSDEPYGRVADCVDDQGLPFALWTGELGPGQAPGAVGGIEHVVLRVPDARRAMGFYGPVLGWTFSPARIADGWNVRTGGGEPRPRTSVWGGQAEAAVVPAFVVPDLAAAVRAVRRAGGTSTEPERRPFGEAAECTDDQGLRFQLVAR